MRRSMDGYRRIFISLKEAFDRNEEVNLDDLASKTGYKLSSFRVYFRNKLKNEFLLRKAPDTFTVAPRINECTENEFIRYMSQKVVSDELISTIDEQLLKNSIQSILSAIEIHNKPLFTYRYEIVVILIINAWELILKAFISIYMPEVKLQRNDGTYKPFDECLDCVVDSVGKKLFPLRENIRTIYEYRCNFIHFYSEKLDPLMFSLIQKSISYYNNFITEYFDADLSEYDDLFILPIGFKKPVSPIDFLTNTSALENSSDAIKTFISKIVSRISELNQNGLDDPFFVPFAINYQSEKRVKNADIVAAINNEKQVNIAIKEIVQLSDNPEAKQVRIKEDSIYENMFNLTFKDIVDYCRKNIHNWKQNRDFYNFMRELKKEPQYHRIRLLDPKNPKGVSKDFYSSLVLEQLQKLYDVSKIIVIENVNGEGVSDLR